ANLVLDCLRPHKDHRPATAEDVVRRIIGFREGAEERNRKLALQQALVRLGNSLLQQRLPQEAKEVYQQAIKVYQESPSCAELLIGLGNAIRKTNPVDSDEAEAAYREALKSDPTNPVARLELGKLLLDSGRVTEGIAVLEMLSGSDSERTQAAALLG